jgi:DNA-binding NarL/FixJ family response regulator
MIKVAIVDDQKVVTQGLKALLEVEPDVEIVGTGSNGREAIELAETLSPDVLLIDQYMPIMDGTAATRIISGRFPKIAVLLLSGSESDDTVAAALQAGAKGYLLKSTSAEELADSIRSVHRGYSQMGPGLMEKFLARMNAGGAAMPNAAQSTASLQPLTDRLQLLLSDSSQFDAEAMRRLLDSVSEPGAAAELMTQIERRLQRNPNHVSALYLAGQLIHEFNQHSRLSLNHFRLAYQHAQQQNLQPSVRFHICRAAWSVNVSEAFGWLREMLNVRQSSQSHSEFFMGLAQVFGASSDPYRMLKAVWEIQQVMGVCREITGLRPKVDRLIAQKQQYNGTIQASILHRDQAEVITIGPMKERSLERN